MEVLILGSNSAAFAYGRHHTAQILKNDNKFFLIDCGEGTQIQMRRYKVKLSRIHAIFISHLHGDHYFGLTGLLNTMHLFGREAKLRLVGPPGLRDVVSLQLSMSRTSLSYPIEFTEWIPETEQLVYEDQKLTVTTIPLDHRIDCSGYFFIEKPKPIRISREAIPDQLSQAEAILLKKGEDVLNLDGSLKFKNEDVTLPPNPSYSYAYCSDTKYMPELAEKIKNTNLIYHESSFTEEMAERATSTFHSTARQAAQVAKDAKANGLLLGHFSSRYSTLDGFLTEAREIFEETELAIEGQTFKVV
ncbi:MAG: ribonuclease Z [Cytophagales bacterium]|nr:ribonuclease Z [Cytophagales bacterium]